MPSNPVPSRQIETRAGNKSAHPGNVTKPKKRRTAAEVEEARVAKAKAKEDRELARKQSIERAAQFERADMVCEDDVDATPRPAFTPKPRPPPQNQSRMTSLPAETSDVEMSYGSDFDGDFDRAPFVPPPSADGSTVDDSTVENDTPPPAKKAKAAAKGKGKETKKAKAASKKKTAEESEVEIVEPKAEPPKEPKPKKKNFRDEINIAAKELEEVQAKKFGGMVKSMRGGEEPKAGKPASKPKGLGPWWPQATTAGEKGVLKREGAIGDINDLFDNEAIADKRPDQESKRSDQNDET
jgi:hypothetical protein